MLTSVSISYFFLVVAIIAIAAYLYFKLLIIKTDPTSDKREKIMGNIKDPENWRERNRKMCHVCMFWFIVSIFTFIILKFFYKAPLIPMIYLVIYAIFIILSIIFYPGISKKAST